MVLEFSTFFDKFSTFCATSSSSGKKCKVPLKLCVRFDWMLNEHSFCLLQDSHGISVSTCSEQYWVSKLAKSHPTAQDVSWRFFYFGVFLYFSVILQNISVRLVSGMTFLACNFQLWAIFVSYQIQTRFVTKSECRKKRFCYMSCRFGLYNFAGNLVVRMCIWEWLSRCRGDWAPSVKSCSCLAFWWGLWLFNEALFDLKIAEIIAGCCKLLKWSSWSVKCSFWCPIVR